MFIINDLLTGFIIGIVFGYLFGRVEENDRLRSENKKLKQDKDQPN